MTDEHDYHEHDLLLFPAVLVRHAHADPDELDDGEPETVLRVSFHNPDDYDDVLVELVMDVHLARALAASLIENADNAECCLATHPDLQEFQ